MYKIAFLTIVSLSISPLLQTPAFAQGGRNYDPNLNHFYMGRQQVQIIDESPMVSPGSSGAAGGGRMNGSLPNRPMALPAAGWQSYTPAQPPGFASGLPKVINGVPPKPGLQQQSGPAGQRGKAGALAANKAKGKGKGKPSQVATTPSGASAYKPYATYQPAQAAAGANNQQSTTNVRGNILHWARGPHRQY